MSDQPKPTGEWSPEYVARLMDCVAPELKLTRMHNAALAEAKSGGWLSNEALDEYAKVEQEVLQLRKQLAAEQKMREAQGQAYERLKQEHQLKFDKLLSASERLEQQLDAERGKMQTLVDALKYYARTADNVKVATDAIAKVKE